MYVYMSQRTYAMGDVAAEAVAVVALLLVLAGPLLTIATPAGPEEGLDWRIEHFELWVADRARFLAA
jgi:hypothetical protein